MTEAVGQPITLMSPPDWAEEEPVLLDGIKRGESVEHYETARRCKDGRLISVAATITPIRDAGGEIVGASRARPEPDS